MDRTLLRALLGYLLVSLLVAACGSESSRGFGHVTSLRLAPGTIGERGDATDGEFALHDGEARLSWRTRAGETATVQLAATPGARVEIAAAAIGDEPVRARVSMSVEGGASAVVFDEPIERAGWVPIAIDLDPHAGSTIDLTFSVGDAAGETAAIDWGEPVLLARRDARRPPNIVLITLDTTRADVADDSSIAPHLAELATRGVAFTNAWSAATSTTPSHASILTGLPVERHGAVSNHSALSPDTVTLAEMLKERGYQTAASVTVNHIGYEAGFGQGFGRFRPASPGDSIDGADSVDTVLGWLDAWSADDARPFFLWVHLFDPHTPYGPPRTFIETELAARGIELPPTRVDPPSVPIFPGRLPTPLAWLDGITNRAHVDALYRAGVAYADHLAGRLFDRVDAVGQRDTTLIVVTADHGEALGEQGVFYQHAGLWPASLRVPLIVAGPGWSSGERSDARVGGLDILPSLIAAADDRLDAAPLEGQRNDLDPGRRIWFAETGLLQLGFRDGDVHFAQALGAGQYGVVVEQRSDGPHVRAIQRYPAGRAWLFDTRSDPELIHDLSGDPGAGLDRYRALVGERARGAASRIRERHLSERERSELRALGYADDDATDPE